MMKVPSYTWIGLAAAISLLATGCGGTEGSAGAGAGGACTNSNDCAVGACRDNVCNSDACERDAHCGGGRVCDFSTGVGVCLGTCADGATQACQTACGDGQETCSGGVWGGCTAPQPGEEFCNGADDDCDGQIDEGLPCAREGEGEGPQPAEGEGEGPQPAEGEGEGEGGQPAEGEGEGEGEGEEPPCEPTGAEECDGVDNDCNGQVDDGLTRPCSTDCGEGQEQCANGEWVACSAREPLEAEICGNQVDDDCDDDTDEVEDCPPECVQSQVILCDGVDQDCDADREDEYPSVQELANLDPAEPNNDCTCVEGRNFLGEDPNGEERRGLLYVGDDNDYYCFDGVDNWGGESIVAELTFVPPGTNFDLYLYRDAAACTANDVLAASESAGGATERIEVEEGFFGGGLTDGRYFIRVRRAGGVSCTDQYTLRVTGLR